MQKLQTFALAAIVATTIGLGGLVSAPSPAHAATMARIKCEDALKLSDAYITTGNYYLAAGNTQMASYYYGRSTSVVQAAC